MRYPPLVQTLLDMYLVPLAPRVPRELLALSHYSHISRLLCFNRVKIKSANFNDTIFPNLYCMTFLMSGAGKDLTSTIVGAQFTDVKHAQQKRVESYVHTQNSLIDQELNQQKDGKPKYSAIQKQQYRLKYEPYAFLEELGNATEEGIFSHRQEMEKAGFGSFHFSSSEFIDFISRGNQSKLELLDAIKDGYESGNTKAKGIKSDKNPKPVNGVPITAFMHSSISHITSDQKVLNLFTSSLSSGFARRSFVLFFDKKLPLTEESFEQYQERKKKAEQILDELLRPMINEINDSTTLKKTIIELTPEAEKLLYSYRVSNEKKCEKLTAEDSIKAEISDRHRKAVRLAACIAMYEHPSNPTITVEDYQYAIDFTEHISSQLFDVLNLSTVGDEEKIYRLIKGVQEKNGYATKGDIIQSQHAPKNQNKKYEWYDALIPHLSEFCSNRDEQLVIVAGAKNSLEHRIEPKSVSNTTQLKAQLSFTASHKPHPVDGYKPLECRFEVLHENIKKAAYSSAFFRDGYRDTEHLDGHGNLVIIDVDEKMSLQHAVDLQKASPYHSLIITTQNHQKQGKGDRFRVILPTATPLAPQHGYKNLMTNILSHLSLLPVADVGATTDQVRYYKPSPADAVVSYKQHPASTLDWRRFDTPPKPRTYTQPIPTQDNSHVTFTDKDNRTLTWRDFDHLTDKDTSPVRCIYPAKHKNGDKHPSAFIGRHTNGTLMFKCTTCNSLLFET